MATYTNSMGGVLYQGATSVTEDLSRVNGFIAGCGEAALLVVLNAVKGVPTTPQDVTNLINQAVNAHKTVGGLAASGESSPSTLEYLANQHGVTLSSGDYRLLLKQYAGSKPVLLGVSNATAFGGRDATVRGHYITVVGKTSDNRYIVSDPNSAESKSGQFIVYSQSQIDAAQPFYAAIPNGPSLASVGSVGGGGIPVISGIGDALGTAGILKNIGDWFSNPTRILKIILGSGIIMIVIAALLFDGVFNVIVKTVGGSGAVADVKAAKTATGLAVAA